MDDSQEYIIKKTTTCNKHYWVKSMNQDDKSDLVSYNCLNCPTGANLNAKDFKVEEGEICRIS